MIRKTREDYVLYAQDGSREEALRRERQVQFFKHLSAKRRAGAGGKPGKGAAR